MEKDVGHSDLIWVYLTHGVPNIMKQIGDKSRYKDPYLQNLIFIFLPKQIMSINSNNVIRI